MALQGNFEFNGITIPNAYIRIKAFIGSKFQGWHVNAEVFASKDAANIGTLPITYVETDTDYVIAENPYDTCYKALNAFLGVTEFVAI